MFEQSPFSDYVARLRDFIGRQSDVGQAAPLLTPDAPVGSPPPTPAAEAEFDQLARDLFSLQTTHNPVYRQFCDARGIVTLPSGDWREAPALPTSAFKEFEVTSLAPGERTTVFHSSGTTERRPGRHFHNAESLALYAASAAPWFSQHLLTRGRPAPAFIVLTPADREAPHSSLAHMFSLLARKFAPEAVFTGRVEPDGGWRLDFEAALEALSRSVAANRPVAVLGTAFNFAHLLDYLDTSKCSVRLPRGSRVLETGGYKGRSRVIPKDELHELLARWLGVSAGAIVREYGMCELSSQAYDQIAVDPASARDPRGIAPRWAPVFRFPAWARAQVISPETGREVADGETGLIRVCDLANVRSVMAVQTEDLGIRHGNGFELIGRAGAVEPRGCSLMSANS